MFFSEKNDVIFTISICTMQERNFVYIVRINKHFVVSTVILQCTLLEFPNDLKHAYIVWVYKKNNKCEKENYRPASILSHLSKMYNQVYEYFENMRENEFVALITDLSKTFDCINHSFLIAKLFVSLLFINMIFSFLNNQRHLTTINECFNERSRIENDVSQGSILCPLLFNIDLIIVIKLSHIFAQVTPRQ